MKKIIQFAAVVLAFAFTACSDTKVLNTFFEGVQVYPKMGN